jgi:hypothetical protein
MMTPERLSVGEMLEPPAEHVAAAVAASSGTKKEKTMIWSEHETAKVDTE